MAGLAGGLAQEAQPLAVQGQVAGCSGEQGQVLSLGSPGLVFCFCPPSLDPGPNLPW